MPRAAVIVSNQTSKCSSTGIVGFAGCNRDRLSTIGSGEGDGSANKKESARQTHYQGRSGTACHEPKPGTSFVHVSSLFHATTSWMCKLIARFVPGSLNVSD
jgi:hypothetical protein